MFADYATVILKSGKGGDGHVSFHREKFVANGGPDGGDGGDGGDVIFEIDEGLNTLYDFRHRRKYAAENGEEGKKSNCHGKRGQDLVVKVPAGTVIKELTSGRVIADMSGDNKRQVILKGGRGGLGNQHFATARMQVPKYAQPGKPGIEIEVKLELKCIADVGLVGFPNVGKSTLLSRVTNAKPKIANYHFTTLNPNLGVVDLGGGEGFVIADIPGLIEGASEGVGLGHEFLRHIERTRVIIHVVDAASTEGRDPIEDILAINRELSEYDENLADKPWVIAANKMDALADESDVVKKLRERFEPEGVKVYPISAVSGKGVDELMYAVRELLDTVEKEPVVFEQEYFPDVELKSAEEPFTVDYDEEEGVYVVEGDKIDRMLGYTNIDSEKGFLFFQKFLKDNQIIERLKELGIEEGDTVRMYGLEFDYYE